MSPLAAALLLAAPPASAQNIEVLYSKIDVSPTSDTPWTLDLTGAPAPSKWRSIDDFAVSHDGSTWVLKGSNRLSADETNMLVMGSAGGSPLLASNLAQEGQPVPTEAPGVLWDFFDSIQPVAFDSTGNMAMSGRSKGPPTGQRERIMKRTSAGVWSVVLREGDPLVGLTDTPATSAGDEALGNSVSSVHLLDDGRVGYVVTPIQNCSSFNYPAFLHDNTGFLQTGASTLVGGEVWDGMDLGDSGGTPDGTSYYIQGDTTNTDTAADDVFTVNNTIVMQEGQPVVAGGPIYADTFQANMAASGDWIARGDDPANDDWLVMNGLLLAKTGDSVEGGVELYADSFAACTVNSAGDWALIATTDNPDAARDEVLVVNGVVLVREGDPVDLDGNGSFDDGVFIGDGTPTSSAFAPNDLAVTTSGMVYFIGRLNDGMGNDLNDAGFSTPDAFLRVQANVGPGQSYCFGDGTGVGCPCGNAGAAGEGCANSTGAGAIMTASGTADVSNDSLLLTATQCPIGIPGIFFQGHNALVTPVFLGDGLLCFSGPIQRFAVTFTDAVGGADSSATTISVSGAVNSGDTRSYQFWYRNPPGPCSGGSNLSNAIEVLWQ